MAVADDDDVAVAVAVCRGGGDTVMVALGRDVVAVAFAVRVLGAADVVLGGGGVCSVVVAVAAFAVVALGGIYRAVCGCRCCWSGRRFVVL